MTIDKTVFLLVCFTPAIWSLGQIAGLALIRLWERWTYKRLCARIERENAERRKRHQEWLDSLPEPLI